MGTKPMASDDRIRLSPDDRNCCVSKLKILAYGSTSYVASSSIMKYAHQVPDRPEQINFPWSGYLSAMDKGHLQPLNITRAMLKHLKASKRMFCGVTTNFCCFCNLVRQL